jgi:hypothetical protein
MLEGGIVMALGKPSAIKPRIIDLPRQKMAVARGKGAPEKVFATIFPALYGSVYTLKFGLKKMGLPTFKVSPPRARYPDSDLSAKDSWNIVVGLPVPEETTKLPQKVPGTEIRLETWDYGPTAEIMHLGPYDQEVPTVEKLHEFIRDNGYVVAGPHEEEYLTRPDAKVVKTIVRYPVKKAP